MNFLKKSAPNGQPTPAPAPRDDLHVLVDLLEAHAKASGDLASIQQTVDMVVISAAGTVKNEHTAVTARLKETEAEIERLVHTHPEWFAEARSIPTPFGTVQPTRSTKLEPDDEYAVMERLATHRPTDHEFFIRTEKTLNLETLKTLSDDDLRVLGIRRVTADNCTIKAAKLNLGQVMKRAAKVKEAGK